MIPPSLKFIPAIALSLVFIILSAIPSSDLPIIHSIQIMLVLHPIYYWTIVRPTLFPFWLCFLSGMAIDLISGSLLGLHAFLLVLVALIILQQRRFLYGQLFPTLWAGFMAVAVGFEVVKWALASLGAQQLYPLFPQVMAGVINFALFPVINALLIASHRLVSGRPNG